MGVKRIVLWAPLALFILFVVVVAGGLLKPTDTRIVSKLVGKPLPEFALPAAAPGKPALATNALRGGEPRLLNIFASWCIPCAAEAPQLMALAKQGVKIEAIAIRDKPEDVAAFLKRWGDPYRAIGSDTESRVQMALGSSGVPETFVVDGRGIIRHQHIGDIRPEHVPEILAALDAAR
jgi:cytochrome c biogenesis protein CcmG/thiol:disulfide interchange protein DsbE